MGKVVCLNSFRKAAGTKEPVQQPLPSEKIIDITVASARMNAFLTQFIDAFHPDFPQHWTEGMISRNADVLGVEREVFSNFSQLLQNISFISYVGEAEDGTGSCYEMLIDDDRLMVPFLTALGHLTETCDSQGRHDLDEFSLFTVSEDNKRRLDLLVHAL